MWQFGWREWLRRRAAGLGTRSGPAARAVTRRPQVEPLEERLVPAAVLTQLHWVGGGSLPNSWNFAANWQENTVPANGDDLFFPDNAVAFTSTNDVPGLTTIHSINFEKVKGTQPGYVIDGTPLTLTGPITDNLAGGTSAGPPAPGFLGDRIQLSLTLSGPTSVSVTNANELLSLTGSIGGPTGSISKAGPGRAVLSGNNSYASGTDVTDGEVNVQSNTALGTGSATVEMGAALELQPSSQQAPNGQPGFASLTLGNNITLNGPGVGGTGALRAISGFNTLLGSVTLAADSTIGVDSSGVFLQVGTVGSGGVPGSGGTITGAGGLTKVGQGALLLCGPTANGYAGPTAVDDGFLILQKSPDTVAVPHDLTIGTGAGSSTTSMGSSSVTTSPTVILEADEQIADNARVTINSDGELNVNFASETIGSLTGSGLVRFAFGTPSGSSTTSLSGPQSGTLRVGADNTSTIFAGAIAGSGGNFVKIGGGVLVLQGNSPFGGTTTVSGGALQVDGSLASSAAVVNAGGTLSGTGTVGPLTANAGGVVAPGDSPGILSVYGGATFNPGSVLLIQIDGTVPGTGSSPLSSSQSGNTFQISLNIGEGGYSQLNVAGPVTLNGPTLRLALGADLPRGADLIFIANNGPGPVTGTFAGLPEDTLLRHGDTFFDLSYAGGRGRDVDLLTQSRDDIFVRALFADFNAPSSRATRAPFETRASSGESRLTVARDFLASPVRRMGEVNLFYATFGMPDDGLKGRYVRQLLAGVPAGQVLINFLTSATFRRLHRNSQAFLRQLFAGLLGHAPGARARLGGHTLAFYVRELNAGAISRADLVRQLLSADEVYTAAVMQNFGTFLGTMPTPTQMQTVAGQLLLGGLDPDSLSESIVAQETYIDFFLTRGAANRVPGVVLVNV
jgi:autotransporter-associated beta strand protein